MSDPVTGFYDDFSEYYHLVYSDWHSECANQAGAIDSIIRNNLGRMSPDILDATCGIGTQVLGLAALGYRIDGADFSHQALERAKREAQTLRLPITFFRADIRELTHIANRKYDLVISCENSLPHLLTDADLRRAFVEMRGCLLPGGACLVTVRDYEKEPREGKILKPYGVRQLGDKTIVLFQLWEFDGDQYDLYWYFIEHSTKQTPAIRTFKGRYYAVTVSRLMTLMEEAGFTDVHRLDGTYFQPVITGINPEAQQ